MLTLPEDPTDDAFYLAMSGEREDLAFVLRGALYVEHALIRFIEAKLVAPGALEKAKLSYAQRVDLAAALGMTPTLVPALRLLGNIRNKFAHRPGMELTELDARDFINSLDVGDRIPIPQLWVQMELAGKKPFEQLAPSERFCFMIVCLRSILLGESTYGSPDQARPAQRNAR